MANLFNPFTIEKIDLFITEEFWFAFGPVAKYRESKCDD